jgi:hypothetical protein
MRTNGNSQHLNNPVTLWYRYNDLTSLLNLHRKYVFNHIEDGHCLNEVPTSKCPSHIKSWVGKWKKELAYLTDSIPAKIVNETGKPFRLSPYDRL